jgi:hypothetical protein
MRASPSLTIFLGQADDAVLAQDFEIRPTDADSQQIADRRNSRSKSRARFADRGDGFFVAHRSKLWRQINTLQLIRTIEWE